MFWVPGRTFGFHVESFEERVLHGIKGVLPQTKKVSSMGSLMGMMGMMHQHSGKMFIVHSLINHLLND